MPVPANPKIYHIVHVDNLTSIIAAGGLLSDAEMAERPGGTVIGMGRIKARRLNELSLSCHPALRVGQCVPFYFCSRSVMLYMIHKRNEELTYRGGQEPIVHLEADMRATIDWAQANGRRWAYTLSNAGSYYFEDRSSLDDLGDVNWNSVNARQWAGAAKDGKQAEFLIEQAFPWHLVERIGVHSQPIAPRVAAAMHGAAHRPVLEIKRDWYY
tara:strand:- start:11792 stop:12430 length:639 start_codon:yes stop_codon:yes gene_type:complete